MRLGLGTVQLGVNYGIANELGMPEKEAALDMLALAYESCFDFLDTAPTYGVSENIIGEFVEKNRAGSKKFNVCTKGMAKYKDVSAIDGKSLEQDIICQVESSLKNLKLNKINWFLLHNSSIIRENGSFLSKAVKGLKERGFADKFGVSVYTPEEVRLCLRHDFIDVIQLPFNILDTRQAESGLLSEMNKRGIEIHARSIYLQGALIADWQSRDEKISGLSAYTAKLRSFAESMNLTVKQLAFLFVRYNRNIDGMIVGCESLRQVEENIELFNMKPIDMERVWYFIKKELNGVAEEIVNPTLWKLPRNA